MKDGKATLTAVAFCCLLAAPHSASFAADSASFEFGTGSNVRMVRAAAQWQWGRQLLSFKNRHIGGYWDLSLAQWKGNKFRNTPGQTQHITSIGITPVFRFQNNTLRGLYLEGGIGAHYLSDLYNNSGNQLSTRFQFGDHIGIGYVFQNNADLGLKFQHFSNGGIKQPNSGVNVLVMRLSYPF